MLTQFQVSLRLQRVDDVVKIELLGEILCGAAVLNYGAGWVRRDVINLSSRAALTVDVIIADAPLASKCSTTSFERATVA